ncbi:hypothetical protein [Nocardia sp. NPDC127526]|uniref:hypothetical protein n=1 Tax=Nocardia sp. NPDC127526 TaxID=3345393 RepID=UPI00362CC379
MAQLDPQQAAELAAAAVTVAGIRTAAPAAKPAVVHHDCESAGQAPPSSVIPREAVHVLLGVMGICAVIALLLVLSDKASMGGAVRFCMEITGIGVAAVLAVLGVLALAKNGLALSILGNLLKMLIPIGVYTLLGIRLPLLGLSLFGSLLHRGFGKLSRKLDLRKVDVGKLDLSKTDS